MFYVERNFVGDLQEFCHRHKYRDPTYIFKKAGDKWQPAWICDVTVGAFKQSYIGLSKAKAKRFAARKILREIKKSQEK